MPARILIIDDDLTVLRPLEERLSYMGHDTLTATTGYKGLDLINQEQPDIVILDLELPDIRGLDILRQTKMGAVGGTSGGEGSEPPGSQTPPVIIILTVVGSIPTVVQAMQLGAFDFIPKPYTAAYLSVVIDKALQSVTRHRRYSTLRREVDNQFLPIPSINKKMLEQVEEARRAAATDLTVLLLGETGTGKEVFARAIHRGSSRLAEPFVPVNCAAFPDTLIESELFGHDKGAFTGATSMKRGQFEQADGGTIFLDEIGDMSLPAQAKVLRVLQEKTLRRVGGTKEISVNVRVLAATNKDLREEIKNKQFREDLYYRLTPVRICLPSLRERMEDVPNFVEHFLAQPGRLGVNRRCKISHAALDALQRYPWPGNIRELMNVLAGALMRCTQDTLEPQHFSWDASLSVSPSESVAESDEETGTGLFKERTSAFQKMIIEEKLRDNGGNQTKTATDLGITRGHLTKLLTKFKISRGN